MSEPRWSIEWIKDGTDSYYMEGHDQCEQITTETGGCSPLTYDGAHIRHLSTSDPKLWKISLSGFRRSFRGGVDQPTYNIRNDPHPQKYMIADSRPEHNWAMLQQNVDTGGESGEFFFEHADVNETRIPAAHVVSTQRLIAADFLDGGEIEGRADYSIPVYIVCALMGAGGESYLGLDDHDNVIRNGTPQVWYLRRGRNAVANKSNSNAVMRAFDASVAAVAGAAGIMLEYLALP